MYVYEEPVLSGTDEGNLFCHHDLLLPAFPLCISWLDCPFPDKGESHSNSVAVGTMYPGIEIWDLNAIDALEPKATLGGYEHALMQEGIKGGNREIRNLKHVGKRGIQNLKATRRSGSKIPLPVLRKDSHTDAVLGLSWNTQHRNVLASASADCTVRISGRHHKRHSKLYHIIRARCKLLNGIVSSPVSCLPGDSTVSSP